MYFSGENGFSVYLLQMYILFSITTGKKQKTIPKKKKQGLRRGKYLFIGVEERNKFF